MKKTNKKLDVIVSELNKKIYSQEGNSEISTNCDQVEWGGACRSFEGLWSLSFSHFDSVVPLLTFIGSVWSLRSEEVLIKITQILIFNSSVAGLNTVYSTDEVTCSNCVPRIRVCVNKLISVPLSLLNHFYLRLRSCFLPSSLSLGFYFKLYDMSRIGVCQKRVITSLPQLPDPPSYCYFIFSFNQDCGR